MTKGRIVEEFIRKIHLNTLWEERQVKKLEFERELSKQTVAAFSLG